MKGLKHIKRLLGAMMAACLVAGTVASTALPVSAAQRWVISDVVGSVTAASTDNPREDFAVAVNKNWMLTAKIKPGYTATSAFADVSDETTARIQSIIHSNATDHETQLIQKYYGLLTDWDTRNKLGVTPLQPYVNVLANMQTLDELTAYISNPELNAGGEMFCSFGPSTKLQDPTHYEVAIGSTGLIRGDAAEYPKATEYGAIQQQVYDNVVAYMLGRLGFDEAQIKKVIKNAGVFENAIAPSMLTEEDWNAFDIIARVQHPVTMEQIKAMQGGFPLSTIIEGQGFGGSAVYNLYEPEWLTCIGKYYKPENFDVLRDYVLYSTVSNFAGSLDREAYETVAQLTAPLTGTSELPDDETMATNSTMRALSGVVENLYIRKYCSAERRAQILKLVKEVVAEYRKMLAAEDWLTDETRAAAVAKLDALTVRACYPDRLNGYGHLDFKGAKEGGDLFKAARTIEEYERRLTMKKVNGSVDANEWAMSTTETNAYYMSSDNSVNILEGILSGAFYNDKMTEEERMAAIGVVIGHEISHAFDTTGSQFNAQGLMQNWWTPADRAAFNQKAQKLIAYYDAMNIPGAKGSYGTQVAGEAIADMGGMRCMLNVAKTMPNFDYDKFFRAYATMWRRQCTSQEATARIVGDSHPLAYLRINCTVQQFQEFYDTYGVQPGDGMYLAPQDRVAVW